jgi:hypothetical protein
MFLYVMSLTVMGRSAATLAITAEPIDLGTVQPGQKIAFEFQLRNTTPVSVKIERLIPSCGCTTVGDVAGKLVNPDERFSIKGILDTENRRGLMQTHLALSYRAGSDTMIRNTMLTVRSVVHSPLRVVPEPVIFAYDPNNRDSLSQTVTIDSHELESFAVVEAVPSAPWIHVNSEETEFRKSGGEPRAARLRIAIDPEVLDQTYGSLGSGNQSLRVRTTVRSLPDLLIPIEIRRP